MNLTVNADYSRLVPEMSESEFESLKESIRDKGLWVPIIINRDGVILDGHHRYHACIHTGITINTIERNFETKLDEEIFVLECNAKRRHLDDLGKHKIYENLKPRYAEKSKLRLSESGGDRKSEEYKNQVRSGNRTRSSKEKEEGNSSTQAAKQTNLSRAKAERMDYIKDNDPELYEQIGKSDRMTVNKAFTTAKKNVKREIRQEEIKKIQVNLPNTVQLHNQEFQSASIPDHSISLIFTDPPYHDKYLHLYKDLAIQASKVLRDGGSLVCYVGQGNIGKVINLMEEQGLKFWWPIVVKHSGPSASVFGKKVLVACKIMLWFVKGKYEGGFVRDFIQSEFQDKELHEWQQSTVESDYYIEYLTIENEIVYDPFLGSGTFGVSAVKLKRQFIGCEVDPEHFATAERMISDVN